MPLRLIALTEFRHEQGHCFIAPLPGGLVDGDAADRRKSGLILFENGLALGPAHSSHAVVREARETAPIRTGDAIFGCRAPTTLVRW